MSTDSHRFHRPTEQLLAWSCGDPHAFDQLVPMVHAELRRLARQ